MSTMSQIEATNKQKIMKLEGDVKRLNELVTDLRAFIQHELLSGEVFEDYMDRLHHAADLGHEPEDRPGFGERRPLPSVDYGLVLSDEGRSPQYNDSPRGIDGSPQYNDSPRGIDGSPPYYDSPRVDGGALKRRKKKGKKKKGKKKRTNRR